MDGLAERRILMDTPELTVAEAIAKRRSIKQFKPDPIPEALLDRLIELTMQAPSGLNLQPTRLVIVDQPSQKEALAKTCKGLTQIATAPVILIFAADTHGWMKTLDMTVQQACESGAWTEQVGMAIRTSVPNLLKGLGSKLREHAVKDALIAADHAVLVAESLGLNSCFMNGWEEEKVKEIIEAKDAESIVISVIVCIGYALDMPKNPGRLPLNMTVFRGRLCW